MPLLRNRSRDLQALIAATATAREIEVTFVEKDFWVVEVLRAATAPIDVIAKDGGRHRVRTIFKGGTSLSRVYGLIERFSEDVDLLVSFPDVAASTKEKDKVLKGIRDAVTRHLELAETSIDHDPFAKVGVKRNTRYHYPRLRYGGPRVISQGVLLEMGCRGGTYPTHRHELRSMIAEHAIDVLGESPEVWDEFAAVEVEVLAPERTLLEKLAMLHDRASRSPDEKADADLRRGGRHLYDVHQLLSSDSVIAELVEIGNDGVAALCRDIDDHSEGAGFGRTPRPSRGYGHSPLLDPSAPCRAPLASGYDTAMALVYGHRPSFDECIDTIRARAEIL